MASLSPPPKSSRSSSRAVTMATDGDDARAEAHRVEELIAEGVRIKYLTVQEQKKLQALEEKIAKLTEELPTIDPEEKYTAIALSLLDLFQSAEGTIEALDKEYLVLRDTLLSSLKSIQDDEVVAKAIAGLQKGKAKYENAEGRVEPEAAVTWRGLYSAKFAPFGDKK